MDACKNLEGCAFVKYCMDQNDEQSVKGFINIYCKGSKMNDCVRLKLCNHIGKQVVPKNMMPNGYPLPGTTKAEWCEEALYPLRFVK